MKNKKFYFYFYFINFTGLNEDYSARYCVGKPKMIMTLKN